MKAAAHERGGVDGLALEDAWWVEAKAGSSLAAWGEALRPRRAAKMRAGCRLASVGAARAFRWSKGADGAAGSGKGGGHLQPAAVPALSLPLLVMRKILGIGHGGVYDSRRSTATTQGGG